ncbi:hypothetical protein [Peribacillus simplex]|uniref:hypothetical protein n=1 Tax=Peribacillus simplex TaxID=1478 RepID=UPI0036726645
MQYTVKVTLINSESISFRAEGSSVKDVFDRLNSKIHGEWQDYEDANGKGYFKKSDISHTRINE